MRKVLFAQGAYRSGLGRVCLRGPDYDLMIRCIQITAYCQDAMAMSRDILAVMARTSFKNERGDREGERTQVGGSQLCGLTRAVGSLR